MRVSPNSFHARANTRGSTHGTCITTTRYGNEVERGGRHAFKGRPCIFIARHYLFSQELLRAEHQIFLVQPFSACAASKGSNREAHHQLASRPLASQPAIQYHHTRTTTHCEKQGAPNHIRPEACERHARETVTQVDGQ